MPTRLLAQPLPLRRHTLRNRVIMGSMHTGFEEHPEGAEHLAAFYAERAKNGVALIITGGIAPNEQGVVFDGGAKLTHADEVAWHRTVTETVHQHGAKICLQILHTGRYAATSRPVAPSAIATPINPAKPRALSEDEVAQTIADYIQCAKLAQQAGYDGVEIMGSEGYLINQFLAPRTNQRNDAYGGDLARRQRFAIEICQGIRQACGDDFLLIFRLSVLDLVAEGSTWQDTLQLIPQLEQAGIDLFNTGIGWHEARIPTIATCVPRAAFARFTARLKQAARIPVIATNRINTPETAENLLQTGVADAVCLARPLLADAAWVAKAIAGEDADINTCIACNQACLDRIFSGKLTSCLVNPFACRELQMPLQVADEIKNIAVVGAGPAGLAFADTAAQRGHRVTVFESSGQIGGQLNVAKTIPGKPEFHETLRYFTRRMAHPNITLHLNTPADATLLREFDEIVLASGTTPRLPDIEGISHPKVMGYLQALAQPDRVGKSVAIIGAGGIGFDVAERLAYSGDDSALDADRFLQEWQIDTAMHASGGLLSSRPALPSSPRQIFLLQRRAGGLGKNLGKTTGWIHRLRLAECGVQMWGGIEYRRIDDAGLHIVRDGQSEILPVDNVIICAGQEPQRALQAELLAEGKTVHVIGGAAQAGELDAERAILHGTETALRI